jgi:hypothetical protein
VSGPKRYDLFGIQANNDVADSDGNVWAGVRIDGWDAPDQRSSLLTPTAIHGQSLIERYANGRTMMVNGLVKSPTDAAAWLAYDRLTSAMPGLLGSGAIVGYEPVVKSLTVKQSAAPRVSQPLERQVRFVLTVLAEYPWKRALTPVTVAIAAGATVPFTATGSFPAEIQVTTTGAGTVDLTGPGGLRLRTGSLPSGAVLTSGFGFTNPKRTIRSSGGANLYGLIVQPMQWPCVVPGSNSFVNAGTAALSLTYFPTYA